MIKTLYRDNNWKIETPTTFKVAVKKYKHKSSWCFAKENGLNYYNHYTDRGDLYILTRLGIKSKPIALWIDADGENTEFNDHWNKPIDGGIYNFLKDNDGLFKYFKNNTKLDLTSQVLEIHGRRFRYKIEDGVYVFTDIDLSDLGLTELPRELEDLGNYKVKGSFDCCDNNLTSLEGSPKEVGCYFDCSDNNLTSLIGSPKKVGRYFYCSRNNLTSLEGSPKEVEGYFDCSWNNLSSLKGSPEKVGKSFYCYRNKLNSLKGSPKEVEGYFDCSWNNLTSLEGRPKEVGGDFICTNDF